MTNQTFTIIKPNAVAEGNSGKIMDRFLSAGFKIIALKMVRISHPQAEKFYEHHADKPFFGELVDFMTSGTSILAVLKKELAVPELRKLVGNTDPQNAEQGTIRFEFGKSKTANAIHASDSDENATIEWGYFFTDSEIFPAD